MYPNEAAAYWYQLYIEMVNRLTRHAARGELGIALALVKGLTEASFREHRTNEL